MVDCRYIHLYVADNKAIYGKTLGQKKTKKRKKRRRTRRKEREKEKSKDDKSW